MNELQIFRNSEFGELGVLEQDGKPYFPATACAKMLGYANPRKAILDHCNEDGVTKRDVIDSMGRTQTAKFVNEGNLYRLITHSKLPAAERFETWVFDEVLPAIRRTGGYGGPAGTMEQLIEQLALTTAALTKVASIMAAQPAQESECHASPAEEAKMPSRHYCKHRKRYRQSSLLRLSAELREKVDEMICSGDYTYVEITEYICDAGFHVSKSAVGRYARRLDE